MGSPRAGPEGKLAIIAGRDALPRLIAEHRQAAGLPYLVISFAGEVEPWIEGHPHQAHAFEKVGRLFAALKRAGCSHVVFAGAMDRPRLKPWRADGKTVKLVGKIMALVKELGLDKKTLIMFSSDNGPTAGGETLLQLRADSLSDTQPLSLYGVRRSRSATGTRNYTKAA